MESEDVLQIIENLEKTAEQLIQINSQGKTSDLSKSLENQLENLINKMVRQVDSPEKEFLTEIVELLLMLDKKYKFDKILSSGIKFTLLINYVNALIYQKDWKFEKLSECLITIEEVYGAHLCISQKESIFKMKSKSFQKTDQIFGEEALRKIRLAVCLCEAFLQHTAVYSQLGQHEQALKSCQKCFEILMLLINRFSEIFSALKLIGIENVRFTGIFVNDISDLDIYVDFLKTINIPKMSQNELWSNTVPNWKINKENTLKYLYQKIDSQRQQTGLKVLSKKIEKDWVEGFHISNIVKLQPFEVFLEKLEPGEFDENLILQTILTLACCVFSIAAENRFISYKEIQNKVTANSAPEQSSNLKQDNDKKNPKMMEDMSKDLKLQKEQRFILSEKVHLKTLEILTFGLKDSIKLLNHCFQSYKKNYDFNILVIEEVDEPSFSTIRNSEYFYNNNVSQNLEEIDQLNEKIKRLVSNEDFKVEKVYEEPDEPIEVPRISVGKLKNVPTLKQNVFSSLYGPNNRLFIKSKTGTQFLKRAQESDLLITDPRETNESGDNKDKKTSKTTPINLKAVSKSFENKLFDFAKFKMEQREFVESPIKERIITKLDPMRHLKSDKIREQRSPESSTLNFRNLKMKGNPIGHKNGLQRDFLRTMEINNVRTSDKFEPDKSDDRFQKFKVKLSNQALFSQPIDNGLPLKNYKANSLSREHLFSKKTLAGPLGNKTAREIKSGKTQFKGEGKAENRLRTRGDIKIESPAEMAPGYKFSQLISQMNQSAKTLQKFDKNDFFSLARVGRN